MKFLSRFTKFVKTRITHKSQNYLILKNQLVFLWKEPWHGVLRRAIGRRLVHQLSQKSHDGALWRSFCKTDHLNKICYKHGITNPHFIKKLTSNYKNCEVCQVYANRSHWKCFFLPNIHFLGPFKKWGVNLIRLLPMTKRGHQFIIATIDYLTMFVNVQSLEIELWNKHISWMNCGHWKIGSFSLCFVLLIHKEEKFYHVCFIHWRKLKHNVLHEQPFGITDVPEGDKRWWCFALCYCPQINLPSCNPIQFLFLFLFPAGSSSVCEASIHLHLLRVGILHFSSTPAAWYTPSTNLPFAQRLEDSITLLVKL